MKNSTPHHKLAHSISGSQLWPYGIIATFVVFIMALAAWVTFAVSNDVQLVSKDYYAQEIAYGSEMERIIRTRELGSRFQLEHSIGNKQLILRLPSDHARKGVQGNIHLYRPNQAKLDQHLNLNPDAAGVQVFEMGRLPPGKWKINIRWQVGKIDYQYQKTIILPASDA